MTARKPFSVIRDGFRLLRCITVPRLLNFFQLLLSWFTARYLKVLVIPGGPSALSFEPTTRCNLRCPECPSGLRSFTRSQGDASMEVYQHTLEQMKDHLIWLNLYFQGEPLLHPQFHQMVRVAKERGFYVMTSTNGHFLSEEQSHEIVSSGLDRLVVSLDGLDQETYATYRRGGDVEEVIKGIETLCAVKKQRGVSHPYLIVQSLLFRHNIHQVQGVKELKRVDGVDEVQCKKAQFYDLSPANTLIPEDSAFSRYRTDKETGYRIKSKFPNHCRRLWFGSVVTWDGDVIPCCYDKDATHRFGNIVNNPFREIWNNTAYNDFRRQVFFFRKTLSVCTNCAEGVD